MRVGAVRFGRLALAVVASGALVALDGAPAIARPANAKPSARAAATSAVPRQAFKVTVYPAYTTAGQSTTFEVTVANASAPGTPLGSVQLEPPTGFTLGRAPNAPLRRKTLVSRRMLSVHSISVHPGSHVEFNVTGTAALKTCGHTVRHWTSHAFKGKSPSGQQLALQSALSNLDVTVVCPQTAVCGDGGPACSTNLPTSVSSYGVVSTASTGTLHGTIDVGRRLTCGAYQFHDANWYDSVVTPPATPPPTAAVPVVDTVSYTIKNTSLQGLDFCLGATYDFLTASGSQAPAAKLPTGAAGFVGLLPMCTPAAPPCISKISQKSDPSGAGYDAVMTIVIPESGDPWGGG